MGANQPEAGETVAGSDGPYVVAEYVPPPKAELTDEDKELLEEARLAQLMTDDPEGYEQEMIDALREQP